MRSLLLMSAVIVAAAGLSGCCISHSCGTGDCGCAPAMGRLACGGCGDCDSCRGCGAGCRTGFLDRLMVGSGRVSGGCSSCGDDCGGRCGAGLGCGLRGRLGCGAAGCDTGGCDTAGCGDCQNAAPANDCGQAATNDCGGCGACDRCRGFGGGLFGGRLRRDVTYTAAPVQEPAPADCGSTSACADGSCGTGLFGGRVRGSLAAMSLRNQPVSSEGPACGGCGNCDACGGTGGNGGLLRHGGGNGGLFGHGGGNGGLLGHGGGAGGGGLFGHGGVMQAGGLGAGCDGGVCQAGGLCGDHGCGRNGCGIGGKLCLACQWRSLCGNGPIRNHLAKNHPYGGNIPHTPNAELYGQGPMTPTYAYPYYTTRGPRDFLMDGCGPPPIVPSSPRILCAPSIGW